MTKSPNMLIQGKLNIPIMHDDLLNKSKAHTQQITAKSAEIGVF